MSGNQRASNPGPGGSLRIVMLLVAIVGVILAVAFDFTIGLTVMFFGILMLISTWVTFFDRMLYRRGARGVIGETCTYIIDDRGIHYEHPLGSGIISWSALTHVRANDKSIVFGRDRVLAAHIPTSAFATAADRDAFLAFARAHVDKAGAQDAGDSS